MENEKIKISVNNDDHHVTDYLYCWEKMKKRPNKIGIFNSYNPSDFLEYINNKTLSSDGIFTEVIPSDDIYVINEKSLLKIGEFIFICYTHYDKIGEDSIISDVSFLYLVEEQSKVNDIISDIEKYKKVYDSEISIINTVSMTPSGIELVPIPVMSADYDNIDMYFNDDVIKKTNKLIKSIKKSKKGLSILFGERGTGKTTLLNYMASKIDKISIFIPSSIIESTINSTDFISFLKKNKNTILVIDDSEIYFNESYTKTNIFTNNLLQIIDGFMSDIFECNVILSMNVSDMDEVDHVLLDCNNLIDVIEVGLLKSEKAIELSKFINKKVKIKDNIKLSNLLKNKNEETKSKEIGFN
jgi:hypothetical protein